MNSFFKIVSRKKTRIFATRYSITLILFIYKTFFQKNKIQLRKKQKRKRERDNILALKMQASLATFSFCFAFIISIVVVVFFVIASQEEF